MKHMIDTMLLREKHIVIFLAAAILLAPSLSLAAKGGKGKGGGNSSEDVGTGCLFYSDAPGDGITSDLGAVYCHGTDGQVTVPKRLRHDLKKFNENSRTIVVDPVCWGGESVASGAYCFGSPANAIIVQSHGGGDADGIQLVSELNFPAMALNQVKRVALDFDLGKQLHIYFGNATFDTGPTATCSGTQAAPAWVTCDVHDGTSCTAWTISSFGPAPEDDALACLIRYKGGTQVEDSAVQADFTIVLSVPVP
jgi:hypothetical protein